MERHENNNEINYHYSINDFLKIGEKYKFFYHDGYKLFAYLLYRDDECFIVKNDSEQELLIFYKQSIKYIRKAY